MGTIARGTLWMRREDEVDLAVKRGKMVASGAQGRGPSFVLPLASPLNRPSESWIDPNSFGDNVQWDSENKMASGDGPSASFSHSILKPGEMPRVPPGTPPEAYPAIFQIDDPNAPNAAAPPPSPPAQQ